MKKAKLSTAASNDASGYDAIFAGIQEPRAAWSNIDSDMQTKINRILE